MGTVNYEGKDVSTVDTIHIYKMYDGLWTFLYLVRPTSEVLIPNENGDWLSNAKFRGAR